MEQQSSKGMWARYALFLVLSLGVLVLNTYLMSVFGPRRPADQAQQQDQAADKQVAKQAEPDAAKKLDGAGKAEKPGKPDQAKPLAEAKAKVPPKEAPAPAVEAKVPEQWVTLGSVGPTSPYRMLATFTNRGAALGRLELSSPRFHELEDRSGYLGHVVMDEGAGGKGAEVQVVGPGTPAALAGLAPGDVITAADGERVTGKTSLDAALKSTKPGQTISLTVLRSGQERTLSAQLAWRPLEVVRPEKGAPPSFLMALSQIDDQSNAPKDEDAPSDNSGVFPAEIDGAALRQANWEIVPGHDQTHVTFRRVLPKWGLEVLKTFRLEPVPAEEEKNANYPAYHLTFDIDIRNTGDAVRKVAYQLDGPNGLPAEGYWYASKVSRNWGAAGLRDVLVRYGNEKPGMVTATEIAGDKFLAYQVQTPIQFLGVDAQYFSTVLIRSKPAEIWHSQWRALYYGEINKDTHTLANTSFRVTSTVHELPSKAAIQENFLIFAGPKKPDLLAEYQLDGIIYYGWFDWAAIPLLKILHGIHYVIPNYGIAIILLTVLVRGLMFPFSRKQALGAQKMQEIQPELRRIQEKYKNDLEGRGRAQRELFRKHNYNPAGGCLIAFLQLPIFVGLYRALMVDVELRQAPLISESIRWASNLAAPDMLFNWSAWMPEFINRGVGMFGLGPYFNILPIIAVFLFLWQQKKFMPPPADEQAAMQQKMMQYMMIFMGILFYKVASGLCLYFIASSLWSICERQFLPKTKPAGAAPPDSSSTKAPVRMPPKGSNGRDGAASRKKKTPRK